MESRREALLKKSLSLFRPLPRLGILSPLKKTGSTAALEPHAEPSTADGGGGRAESRSDGSAASGPPPPVGTSSSASADDGTPRGMTAAAADGADGGADGGDALRSSASSADFASPATSAPKPKSPRERVTDSFKGMMSARRRRYTHEPASASGGAGGGSAGGPVAKTRAKSQDELGGWQQLAHPPPIDGPIDTRGFDADASAVFKTTMPPQRRLSKDIPPMDDPAALPSTFARPMQLGGGGGVALSRPNKNGLMASLGSSQTLERHNELSSLARSTNGWNSTTPGTRPTAA